MNVAKLTDFGKKNQNNINIFLFEAALGGSIRVQGVYEDLTIQIPPGTPSHTK